MKALYTFLIGCFCVGVSLAQSDIASVEYFFNTDPGIGNGIQLDIDPDVELLNQNFSISTIGLTQGTHRLFMRVVNADGSTSMYTYKTFRISDVPETNMADIVEAEFFFNTDPGFGNGTFRSVNNASVMNRNFSFSINSLPVGTHRVFFRVKNSNNQWSNYAYKTFRKTEIPDTNLADIVEAEYYFNTDPGLGNGTNIDVADVVSLDEDFSIPTTSLPIGTHRMFLRVKNGDNTWSMYANKTFRISDVPGTNLADIVEAEYYFNTDPGLGNGTNIDVADVVSLDENFSIPTNSLPIGTHRMFLRVKNNDDAWSMYANKIFRISEVPITNAATITAAEYFIDVDPGIGNATTLSTINGDLVDENFTIPTSSGIAQGDHYLHIRVQNTDGTWSLYDRKLFEIDGTLGIESEILSEIKIYPIPTSDILNIRTPNSIQLESVVLIDMTGKQILRLQNHIKAIDMSQLPNGIYLLQLKTNSGSLSKRIIKN